MRRPAILLLLAILAIATSAGAADLPERRTVQLLLDGRRIEGWPLAWSKSTVMLLGRDGWLWDFAPADAREFRPVSSSFSSYPASILQTRLQEELGPNFEVTGTGHYLVAHPRGQRAHWSAQFEKLFRDFHVYFNVRGFQLAKPEFPMLAIVLPNQREFLRYAQRDGSQVGNNVLGYYSPTTNRIAMYDTSGGSGRAADRQLNEETIIHEATHQTAFNVGIHTRYAPQPRWVVEGLGTMFEAPGVWDSRAYPDRRDRINATRLRDFQHGLQNLRSPQSLVQIISSDESFTTDASAAYAEAWALTFYLCERYPRDYAAYLKRVAGREAFRPYPASERLADFISIFGDNLRLFDAQFVRYMESL